jgi:Leucine-rich repeat (LRR) protein
MIGNSRLESLPDSFGNLRSLETLGIDKMDFRNDDREPVAPLALPESIGRLSKLKELRIEVPLQSIPGWLGGLSSLQTLDIASDTITALPD